MYTMLNKLVNENNNSFGKNMHNPSHRYFSVLLSYVCSSSFYDHCLLHVCLAICSLYPILSHTNTKFSGLYTKVTKKVSNAPTKNADEIL